MATMFFNRNIPNECHQKMGELQAAGNQITWVAFAPGGGARWSIATSTGAYFNRNIPDECHQKMGELSKNGAKIVCVAFPPQGGNSWSIVNDHGAYFNRNIPDECHQKMGELSKDGAKIVCVAFPPQGGNSWSIVNDRGAYFNRNIPDECHHEMGELSKNGAKVVCVAFPPQGGNRWSIVNDHGGYFNRNIPDEAHMYMGYFASVYGPVRVVAFDSDGDGWSVVAPVGKLETVCDATRCLTIANMYHNIQARLDNRVVGYACSIGNASPSAFSHGLARTSANAPAQLFLPSTKIPVASVSKVVTALAAIRILGKHNIKLDATVEGHLPKDWELNKYVKAMKFQELLSHTSGIKDYGNNKQDDAALKTFFTDLANPSITGDKSPFYSNYNFAIFRLILPLIEGLVDDPHADPQVRARNFADAYVKLVQHNVFEPVGAQGVDARPPASGPQASAYAFSYKYPGTTPGWDWGDDTLGVGAAGWYLSIEDINKVLYSLNKQDGRILTATQWDDMQKMPLGWDMKQDGSGGRWLEKNGGWGWNGTSLSTSIALFSPGVFGALFVNSDRSGPGLQGNWRYCTRCQTLSFAGNADLGACPAGGKHDHKDSFNYLVATSASAAVGQHNWRWCHKCQALSFAGSASQGPCPAGGQHDHAGSGNYILEYEVGADTVLHDAYIKSVVPKP